MEKNGTITLEVTPKELELLHAGVYKQRAEVGNLINQLAGLDLPSEEARTLLKRLGTLSQKLCDAATEHGSF